MPPKPQPAPEPPAEPPTSTGLLGVLLGNHAAAAKLIGALTAGTVMLVMNLVMFWVIYDSAKEDKALFRTAIEQCSKHHAETAEVQKAHGEMLRKNQDQITQQQAFLLEVLKHIEKLERDRKP